MVFASQYNLEIRQNPAKTSSENNENWELFRIESGRAAMRLYSERTVMQQSATALKFANEGAV